jgi:hypothetical protein
MSTKPTFGKKVLSSINERIEPVQAQNPEPVSNESDEQVVWVSFTTAVTRETYLKLKQAEYWVPGFLMKELTEAALVQKLLRTSKKLR